jgi:hypothetical protein
MIMFFAFMMFGLYHLYVTNPEAFNRLKIFAIFSVLHAQTFIEHAVNEGKKLWHICERYVKKNMVLRENVFSNQHILECYAISYRLHGENNSPSKVPYKFSKSVVEEGRIVNNDTMFVTEIRFDTLESVRLVISSKDTFYSMKHMYEKIEAEYVVGYPTRLKCPFMCVEVLYDDNRYDVTGLLKEYLYPGNTILSETFIRMFMFEHLGVYIKPKTPFSLHIVDHNVNMNDIHFGIDEDTGYSYEL